MNLRSLAVNELAQSAPQDLARPCLRKLVNCEGRLEGHPRTDACPDQFEELSPDVPVIVFRRNAFQQRSIWRTAPTVDDK